MKSKLEGTMIDYRSEPLGKIIHSGVIEVCPVCGEHGLVTKRDPKDGVVVIDILHKMGAYAANNILCVSEDTHYSLEPAKPVEPVKELTHPVEPDAETPPQSQTPHPPQS
jgi:hypothetical protein